MKERKKYNMSNFDDSLDTLKVILKTKSMDFRKSQQFLKKALASIPIASQTLVSHIYNIRILSAICKKMA